MLEENVTCNMDFFSMLAEEVYYTSRSPVSTRPIALAKAPKKTS
jgi:hypothetical protein